MKTIKTIICAPLLGCVFTACEIVDTKGSIFPAEGQACELAITFSGGESSSTKALGQNIAAESTIQNVQVFVFRTADGSDGVLDACASVGFDSPLDFDASTSSFDSITLECTTGEREIWAIVNAASDYTSDGSVGNKSSLISKTSSLGENALNKLFMTGSRSVTLSAGSEVVDITVRRACASVILESVTNDMMAAVYQKEGCFRLTGAYLINVPAKINYGLSLEPSELDGDDWYAKLQKESDASKSTLICDEIDNYVLDYGKSYQNTHTFYSYPNNCPDETLSDWSPRATSLVVEAEYNDGIQWRVCYYPIVLYKDDTGTGLESNKQYTVKLTIRRPGSDSPSEPVEFDTLSGSIVVADWETGASYTETI